VLVQIQFSPAKFWKQCHTSGTKFCKGKGYIVQGENYLQGKAIVQGENILQARLLFRVKIIYKARL
jgi:hypothetical protein